MAAVGAGSARRPPIIRTCQGDGLSTQPPNLGLDLEIELSALLLSAALGDGDASKLVIGRGGATGQELALIEEPKILFLAAERRNKI